MNGLPPAVAEVPPLLPPESNQKSSRRSFAILLSLCLVLFLVDGVVSLLDDSLIVFFGAHHLSLLRGIISLVVLIMALGIYGLIGLTPMVPKRLFLPIPLFFLTYFLAIFPFSIYAYPRMQWVDLGFALCEVILAVGLWFWARRGAKFATEAQRSQRFWPLVPVERLGARGFSWRNLCTFVALNVFVLVPFVVVYLFFCIARGVDHFSEGFMTLHPTGFTVQARKYVRDDGKVIELFPMIHIANASFYQQVSQTFPTNSLILMEGVSDQGHLLTNQITYKRMAKSLGLSEQKETFAPTRGEVVRADVDVDVFSSTTIGFLNLIMLIHSKGVNPETIAQLTHFAPAPDFEEQLFGDILHKRNEHLLGEIESHLSQTDNIMVPWGVAHMPGVSEGIQKWGFHLSETHDYAVIRFHKPGNQNQRAKP